MSYQEELARLQLEDRKKKAAKDAENEPLNKEINRGCTFIFVVVILLFVIMVIFGK